MVCQSSTPSRRWTAASTARPPKAWHAWRQFCSDADGGEDPERHGYEAARVLRQAEGLNGGPISSVRDFVVNRAGAEFDNVDQPGGQVRMAVGAHVDGAARVALFVTPRTTHRWGRRFELARALGHLLLDPDRSRALGAASSPFSREMRRRRSGAFAAEFLLPSEALELASGGALDGACKADVFSGLLSRFGVGARSAAYQLWNQGWISSESRRDELITEHASHDVPDSRT